MMLEDIIHPHQLDHGLHDTLIKNVASTNELSPDVMTIAMNAYYKIADKHFKSGYCESDIDLLQMQYDNEAYPFESWQEIPFNNATLLLFEMKSSDSARNYKKAIYQLKRSKDMILTYTSYQKIDTIYAFNKGNGFVWRQEG